MTNGFDWIQYQGLVQMDLFTNDEVANLDTGKKLRVSGS
ncbi:Hypothetical protein AKI40_2670 [Enterobacter sp. FY-07]|nr:Hypothetical protein AKI40_2670 [Enterobacter sp. FY-07]